MKRLTSIFIILITHNQAAWAENDAVQIKAAQLGQLQQLTEVVKAVDSFQGTQLMAKVLELPGQSLLFTAPMNVQSAVYLKATGTSVKANEAFVSIRGPEVHHYYSQYKISQTLYEQSLSLFNKNKRLFESKSLSDAAWFEISQQHYQTQLAFDEYTHFFEYVGSFDKENEALIIHAPIEGVLIYAQNPVIRIDDVIARFIPRTAIRLKINVPSTNIDLLKSVRMGECLLPIVMVEQEVQTFYQSAWSGPLEINCSAHIGSQINITPIYKAAAFLVNKLSLFEWQGQHYLFVYQADNYTLVQVSIVGSTPEQYIVTSSQLKENARVLVSSVSAAQGILMGLGE